MILPSDKFGLLLLADWLEEYGSSYDIVKANAIRNNNYNLNYKNNCKNDCRDSFVFIICGNGSGNGEGLGWGNGCGNMTAISKYGDGVRIA